MPTPYFLLEMLGWTVANAFVLAVAALLWRSLRVGSRGLDLAVFGFLCVFVTTALTMLLGVVGLLRPGPVLAVSLAGLAVVGWAWRSGSLPGGPGGPHFAALWAVRPGAVCMVLLAVLGLQLVRMAVHAWLLPPYVWDVLTYHLVNVAEWMQAGRIVTFESGVDRIHWPACFEVFQTWFVLFPHHDVIVELAGVPVYLMAALCVYSIARSLDMARGIALFAALLYAHTPSVVLHATSGKNDLPIAALYLFVIALALGWHRSRTHGLRTVVLIWMALCLALGTKAYIVLLAPGLLLFVPRRLWFTESTPPPAPAPPVGRATPGARVAMAAAVATGAFVCGYWFVRNWIAFGNPVYPQQVVVGGKPLFEAGNTLSQSGRFSWDGLLVAYEHLLGWKVFDELSAFHVDLQAMTGWGWFTFACGFPALALGLLRSRRTRALTVAFGLSLLLVLGWTRPSPFNMRLTLWFPALFVLAFFLVVCRLPSTLARRGLYALAAACLVLNFVGTLGVGIVPVADWRRMAAMPVGERSSAVLGLHHGARFQEALERVPPGEVIGLHVHPNGWGYPLYDNDFSRRVRYIPFREDQDIADAMRERGVRHLVVSTGWRQWGPKVEAEVARGGLRKIGHRLYVRAD